MFVKVSEGEELTCYYHYLLSDCPAWYADLWEAQGSLSLTSQGVV
jgi:hypothetical protein